MNYKHVDPAELTAAHARGLKDHELAALFGLSRETIKRRRKALGLPSNCPNNNSGKLAEQLVAQHFIGLGLSVMPAERHNAPFDLLVNGWRVDVKVRRHRPAAGGRPGAVEFRIPARRSAFHAQYAYEKDYRSDSDFLALTVLSTAQALGHVYMLPSSAWRPNITVHPESPFCPFLAYRDHWEPLRRSGWAAA